MGDRNAKLNMDNPDSIFLPAIGYAILNPRYPKMIGRPSPNNVSNLIWKAMEDKASRSLFKHVEASTAHDVRMEVLRELSGSSMLMNDESLSSVLVGMFRNSIIFKMKTWNGKLKQ